MLDTLDALDSTIANLGVSWRLSIMSPKIGSCAVACVPVWRDSATTGSTLRSSDDDDVEDDDLRGQGSGAADDKGFEFAGLHGGEEIPDEIEYASCSAGPAVP